MRTPLIILLLILAISAHAQDQIEIQLNPGYNLISINLVPGEDMYLENEDRGPDVPLMFEQLRGEDGEHSVRMVKGGHQFYAPAFNFCNIPFWDLTRGYQVRVDIPSEVVWGGEIIPADIDIPIGGQSNANVAYYPTYELNANADDFFVLSPIIDHVLYAKDGQGGVMVPEFNFSNMNPWQAGSAYWILTDEDVVLNYPEDNDEEPVIFENGNHWELPTTHDYTRPILISLIEGPDGFAPGEGDQIAAFRENGDYCGCGTVFGGMCAVTLLGANQGQDDGLQFGESFSLRYWDDNWRAEYDVNIESIRGHERDGFADCEVCLLSIIEVSVDVDNPLREQIIDFDQVWNMISLNIEPPEEMWEREEGPDIELMMEQLVEDGTLILMKDDEGRFYAPEFEFNGIPYWNLADGYQVNVTEDTECTWFGNPIPPDREITLEEGWNLIPYFPDYVLSGRAPEFYVLSSIIDHVIIAKNDGGRFMAPAAPFSNMPSWWPGNAYHVLVDADVVLQYPAEREEEIASCEPIGNHWSSIPVTDNNMSLLINSVFGIDPAPGSQIAAYTTNGQMVGVGTINDNQCGIAIWGAETGKSGLQSGDKFKLRLWAADQGAEFDLIISTVHEGTGSLYEVDGLSVIDVAITVTPPDNYFLSGAYPNPFNNRTTVKYGLPEAGLVDMTIFDLSGRKMMELVNGEQSAGTHELDVNCTDLTSGIYILSLNVGRKSFSQKLVMVK
jgi:hypothetical protein